MLPPLKIEIDYYSPSEKSFISSATSEDFPVIFSQSNIIWTIWWQGEDNAPESMKMCFESMRINSNGHPVIVISEQNLSEYIRLPKYILKKCNLNFHYSF